jgi:hypothetical protein
MISGVCTEHLFYVSSSRVSKYYAETRLKRNNLLTSCFEISRLAEIQGSHFVT